MPSLRKDPLLSATLIIVRIITILLCIAIIAMPVGLALITIDIANGAPNLSADNPGVDPAILGARLWALLPLAGIGFALAAAFMHLLAKIIASVADSDPFNALNAKRLYRMAWLAFSFQIVAIPIRIAEGRVNQLTENAAPESAIGFGGFVLALTLFVLARVFTHGAAMRDDLEGTV